MKQSHLTTPRMERDATFVPAGTSQPVARRDDDDTVVLWGCLIALVSFAAIMLFVRGAW